MTQRYAMAEFRGAALRAASFGFFSLALAICLILTPAPALARSDDSKAFTLAGRQWLLIESMTNSVLLAALGVDASPSLGSAHWSQSRFHQKLQDLNFGNPGLGLSPATRPGIVNAITTVENNWRRYDAIFNEIVESPQITRQQIQALLQMHGETTVALQEMVDAFQHYVHGGSNHTLLSSTIEGVGKMRAQTQLVLRGLLTVAYENGTAEPRQLLIQATGEFETTLRGLINGDLQTLLLSPPTSEIAEQLSQVDELWRQTRPILDTVAAGKTATSEEIAVVAGHVGDMAVPLTMTLLMYLSL